MNDFFTFRRRAPLALISLIIWCLPVLGGVENNGYDLPGLTGEHYLDYTRGNITTSCRLEKPEDAHDDVYILFQLEGNISTDEFKFTVKGKSQDAEGKLWITPEMFQKEGSEFGYTLEYKNDSQYVGRTYNYTLTLYTSQNTSTVPLAVLTGSQTLKRVSQLQVSPNRVTGELSTPIPFTVTVEANDFAGTQDAMLMISKNEGVSITSKDLEQLQGTELSQPDYYHYFRIGALQDATYNFTLSSTHEFRQPIHIQIVDGDEQTIPNGSHVNVSIPSNVSQTDIDGLSKIAEDNNNDYLRDYISNERYLNSSRKDSIYVEWDENISPARINNLNFMFQSLTTLDVSAFDSLMYLTVNHASIDTLDLSMLKRLRNVGLYNTGITSLTQVKLPDNPDLEVQGGYEITVGEQNDEGWYQIASGEQVNLSQYATIDGEPTTVKWYKDSGSRPENVTAEWVETSSYIFVVPTPKEEDAGGQANYWCEISTATYPSWIVRSQKIQIVRGANFDYSEDDIQLLKDLAAANPDCHELRQFVAAEGWKESWQGYPEDPNRKVAVDWNYETPARIIKLSIRNMSTVTNLDLSGFTELTYLNVSNLSGWSDEQQKWVGIETLDLTKNTKLSHIEVFGNYALKTLNTSGLSILEHVNVSNNQNLSSLDLTASRNTLTQLHIDWYYGTAIDLSQFPNLRVLNLSGTTQYADYLDRLPKSIEQVYCNSTEYPLLNFSQYPYLHGYGVPGNIEELDVRNTSIRYLSMGGSQIRYSTLEAGNWVSASGNNRITIPKLPESEESFWKNETIYDIAVGDTVDLSSEASINGIASRYVWVDGTDGTDGTESTGVFIPVEGKPGKFIYQGGGRPRGFYYCIIANERYCKYMNIHRIEGWHLITYKIMLPEIQATYDPDEVAALEAIVDGTDSPALRQWWESEAWMNGSTADGRFSAYWILDEETHIYHLDDLQLSDLRDTLKTLNVDAFTELRELYCYDNGIKALSLQKNAKLENLKAYHCLHLKTVTLPEAKERLEMLWLERNKELESIDVTGYTNLNTLGLDNCMKLTSAGDLSQLVNLEHLYLNYTLLEPLNTDGNNYSNLKRLGVPRKTKALDARRIENLESLNVSGSMLTFSTLQLKNADSCDVVGPSYPDIEGIKKVTIPDRDEFTPFYLFPANGTIDLSSEMMVGDEKTYVSGVTAVSDGLFTVKGEIHKPAKIQLLNWTYGNWEVMLEGLIVSCEGDANLDTKVNVRDLAVTANYIVQNADALPEDRFGWYEADVTEDLNVDAADMQGIVNLILGRPVTKSTEGLRSGYVPAVELSAEGGYLYIDAEVPVTALQLELTGMLQAEPLLGKAAGLTQVSSVGETTRILGYSLKGVTIPAGKSVLMKFPAGARLAKAVFSDEKAQRLEVRTKGDIATSNEAIRPMAEDRIANYPNPFSGTTTLVYRLDEAAEDVCLQVFSFNGALVEIVGGLPAAAGENRFAYSARLGAGSYLYRLVIRKQGKRSYSKSNTFIIK